MLALDIAVAALFVVGLVLIIRDTSRRSGRWGINLRRVACPRCGAMTGPLRVPKSGRQALWGGRTCRSCGCEMDKWGRDIGAA
jgi:hypothetical protein